MLKAPYALKNCLRELHTVLKRLRRKYLKEPDGETSSDGPFHPPLALCFPKTKMVSRGRLCRSSWFHKFPWLYFDTRYH